MNNDPNIAGNNLNIDNNQPLESHIVGNVNGQNFSQPINVNQVENISKSKPSKWRYLFIVLGILQILGIAFLIITFAWLSQQAKSGQSGTEFIALAVTITIVPALGIIGLVNLIGLPIYLKKHTTKGKNLIFSIISLIISVLLFIAGAFNVYSYAVTVPNHLKIIRSNTQQKINQIQEESTGSEISENEAATLLNTCKLKGFYYTNQSDKSGGNWGNLSSTGVVLSNFNGQPYRISISDQLIPVLVPIARNAQKICGGPQFWHDGNYEQFQNGHWYFNNTIVN